MSDWPGVLHRPMAMLSVLNGPAEDYLLSTGANSTGANAWNLNNQAIFAPVYVEESCTVKQIAFEVTIQSGTMDVGIFQMSGARIASMGSFAVPVAGVSLADIADTELSVGVYMFGMSCSTTAATFRRGFQSTLETMRVAGLQRMAAAHPLPSTATFSNLLSGDAMPQMVGVTATTL